jgi:amidase
LAVIGPVARSVDDLKAALPLIIGPDAGDAVAWTLKLPPPRREGARGLRVAVMHDHPQFPVDVAITERIQAVADFLASRGAEVDDTARPAFDMKAAFRIFMGILTIPMVARRDDEQFWERLSHITQYVFNNEHGEPQDETYLLSHAHWMSLDNARRMVCGAWAEFFSDHDVLICPAAPGVAMHHDMQKNWHERRLDVNGKPLPVAESTAWGALASIGNIPATVARAGLSPAGLPIGVQIIGPAYGDCGCLELAHYLERNFQGFVAPPGWS